MYSTWVTLGMSLRLVEEPVTCRRIERYSYTSVAKRQCQDQQRGKKCKAEKASLDSLLSSMRSAGQIVFIPREPHAKSPRLRGERTGKAREREEGQGSAESADSPIAQNLERGKMARSA